MTEIVAEKLIDNGYSTDSYSATYAMDDTNYGRPAPKGSDTYYFPENVLYTTVSASITAYGGSTYSYAYLYAIDQDGKITRLGYAYHGNGTDTYSTNLMENKNIKQVYISWSAGSPIAWKFSGSATYRDIRWTTE